MTTRAANPLDVADGPVEISEDIASNSTTSDTFFSPDDGSWAAENAGSLVLDGFGNQQVVGTGAAASCRFSGYLVQVAGS